MAKLRKTVVRLNTGDSGKIEKIAHIVNGILECIVISNELPINIRIDYLESDTLFEEKKLEGGTHYIPLRTSAISFKNTRMNFTSVKYVLDGSIVISIKGQRNVNVEVVFKYI